MMMNIGRRRIAISIFSLTFRSHLNSTGIQPTLRPCVNTSSGDGSTLRSFGSGPLKSSAFPIFYSPFTSSVEKNPNSAMVEPGSNSDSDEDEDDNDLIGENNLDGQMCSGDNPSHYGDVGAILEILRAPGSSLAHVKSKLENCGIIASSELVTEVLSRVRNDWEAAFTFFLWAGKQPGYAHSLREYHSMISILGKMRKFDTAWGLIEEMRGGRIGPSFVTPQTLLIMIRRYCAVHDVGKAVNAFYAHKRFNFEVGMEEFQNLLSALCRYKNVKDAEHLLFCNKNVFPFNTKSFNIILNGWCNVIRNPREARRIWREMKEGGISRDVVSYSSIISCYSKFNNLNAVLKLFSQMKSLGIAPDRKVYNAVIHALAKGRHVKEARNLMRRMEEEGIAPNAVTYNSLIKPLSRARMLDELREVFNEMFQGGLSPTIRTYHAFFSTLVTGEEVFGLLEKMSKMGCQPNNDTYIMLIRKFCRWCQLDNVQRLWTQMSDSGMGPDRSAYTALINGLFLNGKLEEAYRYYQEMKDKQLLPEPKTEEMLQAWASGKDSTDQGMVNSEDNQVNYRSSVFKTRVGPKSFDRERDFRKQHEIRRVVRERGFSFWER